MLQNRPNISPYSISPHSKWNVPRAFVGFWGDGTEPGNYFQSYFVFLRFALNVWNDYQVYYCISSMIYISLGQDLCNVAVEGLRWGLPTSSTICVEGSLCSEVNPECRKFCPHHLLLSTHGVWAGDAECCVFKPCFGLTGWTFTSPGGRVAGDFDGTRAEQGKSQAFIPQRAV